MYFLINPGTIRTAAETIGEIDRKLRSCNTRIRNVSNSGVYYGSLSTNAQVIKALNANAAEVTAQAAGAAALSEKLLLIAQAYEDTEKKIAGKATAEKSLIQKLKDKDFSGSVLHGEISKEGKVLGFDSKGKVSGSLLSGEVSAKTYAEWDAKKGKIYAKGEVGAEGSLAEGEVSGNIGLLNGSLKGSAGTGAVSGGVGLTLFNQGRFEPGASIEGEAKVVGLHGEAETHFGNDDNNVHVGAEGDLGVAKAEAEAHVGRYTYKDETTGETKTGFGVGASAGAEAYLAEGKVKGGVNIFGVKIDASLSGKAGGAGAKAGGKVGTDSVEGEVGLGLGLGAGLKVKVDWTGFKLPWKK